MKVLFGSVVYQAAEKYLPDFFNSIEKQLEKNFSLLLLNDDMDSAMLQNRISEHSFTAEIISIKNKTPVQLRVELLKAAKQKNADLLILGDCDDYFSDNRVGSILNLFRTSMDSVFFYNRIVNEEGANLMPEFPKHICDFKEIGEYNFLGLSNTALNMRKISYEFISSLEEFGYEVFDWYLFSRMLLEGMCGEMVDGCSTVYRLHENNIAGISKFNEVNVKREVEVKSKHYSSLKKYHPYYEEKFIQYKTQNGYQFLRGQDYYFWWNLSKSI